MEKKKEPIFDNLKRSVLFLLFSQERDKNVNIKIFR